MRFLSTWVPGEAKARSLAISTLMVFLLSVAVPVVAKVENYVVDAGHSAVSFSVRHFVAKAEGRFDEFSGRLSIDPKNPTTLQFQGQVQAASINTNNDDRDQHLRGEDFFDVENHPIMTFESKNVEIEDGDDDTLEVTGDLTLRGVTKEVTFEVEILGFGPDAFGRYLVGMEATGKINRQDFGISWNKALDHGGLALGDDVEFIIRIEAARQ